MELLWDERIKKMAFLIKFTENNPKPKRYKNIVSQKVYDHQKQIFS
jgi:hypothetical protein